MASRAILVIHFKEPDIDVEIVDNESSKGQLKLVFVLDVIGTHGDRNVAELKDSLRSTFGPINYVTRGHVRFTTQDWSAQLDRQLHVVLSHLAWNYVSMLSFDQVLYLDEGQWRVEHCL